MSPEILNINSIERTCSVAQQTEPNTLV